MILWAVALIVCGAEVCTPQVMEDEVYKGREDCNQRVQQLTADNPGREFECGVVYRRDPQ